MGKEKVVCGLLNIHKPLGVTSHSVVRSITQLFPKGSVKVGHTGTLDPLASGVMILCLGNATKLSSFFIRKDKSYQALAKFGISTNTYDAEGSITKERPVTFDQRDLDDCLNKFRGRIVQTVPAFSAVKVKGKKLYDKARRGEIIEKLPQRIVQINSLSYSFLDLSEKREAVFDVTCSSGTYIRSLVHDIGEELGCGAYLTGLIRTSVDQFTLNDAIHLKEIENAKGVLKNLIPVEKALKGAPRAELSAIQEKEFAESGCVILPSSFSANPHPWVRFYSKADEERFIGVGSVACKITHCSASKICIPK